MLKLLKIELLKNLPSKSFWVFMLMYLIALPLMVSGFAKLASSAANFPLNLTSHFAFPNIWLTTTFFGSYLHYILGLIVISLITQDFNYRMLRQHIMDGMSRFQLWISKVGVIAVLAMIGMALATITAVVFGAIFTESYTSDAIFSSMTNSVWKFGLQAFAYMSLAAMLAYLIRRTAVCFIVFLFCSTLERLSYLGVPDEISKFFPMTVFSQMLPIPYQEMIKGAGIKLTLVSQETALVLGTLYAILFLGIGFWSLNRSNL